MVGEIDRYQLVAEFGANFAEVITTIGPRFLALNDTLTQAITDNGYPPLQLFARSRDGLQAVAPFHTSSFSFTTTPNLPTIGLESFPHGFDIPSYSFYEDDLISALGTFPHVTLSFTAKLWSPHNSPFDFVRSQPHYSPVRTITTSIGLVPVLTSAKIHQEDDYMGTGQCSLLSTTHQYRYAVYSPNRSELALAYDQISHHHGFGIDHVLPPPEKYTVPSCAHLATQHPNTTLLQPEKFANCDDEKLLDEVIFPALTWLIIETFTRDHTPPTPPRKNHSSDIIRFDDSYESKDFDVAYLEQLICYLGQFTPNNPPSAQTLAGLLRS